MTRGPATAVLLGGALLALPAAAWSAPADDGYRLHPAPAPVKQVRPLGEGAAAARTTLAFRAPNGYIFTVTRAAAPAMRRAGARPLYPEAGIWAVSQDRAPALRRTLVARGQLLDATVDEPRRTRVLLETGEQGVEPLLPHQHMFAAVGAAGLEPPPGGEDGGVLVIDSGLEAEHVEFAGRPGLLIDNPQRVRSTVDGEWHGTAVASIVGAPRNGVGIEGLYPTVRLGVWDGGGDGILTSETIRALRRAEVRGYRVVNMSFGGEGYTLPELLAIYRAFAKGILIVAAAGNENQQGNPDEYPALFPHVLTVAATNQRGAHASFSNRKDANDLAAPGQAIVAATPSRFKLTEQDFDCDATQSFCAVDGTSFAAPIVSAAAAWVWAARPDLDVTQIFDLLRFSARDVGPKGFDRQTGFGMLDVRRALSRKAPKPDPLEPNDDVILVDGRLTGRPAAHLLPPGRGRAQIRARLDFTEDPMDVYRVALSKGDRIRVVLRPLDDDCDLVVWPSTTRSVGYLRGTGRQAPPLARSILPGFARDAVTITAPRTGTYYVDVRGNGRYDLVVQRLPRG